MRKENTNEERKGAPIQRLPVLLLVRYQHHPRTFQADSFSTPAENNRYRVITADFISEFTTRAYKSDGAAINRTTERVTAGDRRRRHHYPTKPQKPSKNNKISPKPCVFI